MPQSSAPKPLSLWSRGEPQVWFTGAALSLTLLMTLVLLAVVGFNGLQYFWPRDLVALRMNDGTLKLGEFVREEAEAPGNPLRSLYKIGNRETNGVDFAWLQAGDIAESSKPSDAVALERREYGNYYGYVKGVELPALTGKWPEDLWDKFMAAHAMATSQMAAIEAEKEKGAAMNARRGALQNEIQALTFNKPSDAAARIAENQKEIAAIAAQFEAVHAATTKKIEALRRNVVRVADAQGVEKSIPLLEIVRAYQPNAMGSGAKLRVAGAKFIELMTAQPRESNTEGGLLPAIFGTVMMVFMMSLFAVPLGVVAAVYLREYAREGFLVAAVRVAVNNLAGVPSIVFGVFGLGFFVYGVGGSIDRAFYPERLPSPTFGTGGLLWASLTMALLTLPVVIVSTEEALAAIPRGIREGSLALGATQWQTLRRILLPMAAPGIMTGLVLSMARAAGEVAPLMIVGVVKLAPALALDGQAPFVHLDRKFMHLGFHIYDMGFQSPNAEAARPMVFVSTMILLLIVIAMTGAAIYLRNAMRKKMAGSTF